MNSPIKVKGALRRLHFGPGPHPSGSPQSVHAGASDPPLSVNFPENISHSDIVKSKSVKWGVTRGGRVETLPYEGTTHSDVAEVAGIKSDRDFHIRGYSANLKNRDGIADVFYIISLFGMTSDRAILNLDRVAKEVERFGPEMRDKPRAIYFSYDGGSTAQKVGVEELTERGLYIIKGGPGSGNFGHAGRPGEVGGSAKNIESGINLPLARKIVDGRTVTENIPNVGSISATFTDWDELQGIREVKLSDFGTGTDKPRFATARQRKAAESLAKLIKDNGWIDPLIIVYDRESAELGPYILEGATRFDALRLLGAESFPALVVIDRDPQTGIIQRHGVHVGQKGVPGQVGGSAPGFTHAAGAENWKKTGSDPNVWETETAKGVAFLTHDPDSKEWNLLVTSLDSTELLLDEGYSYDEDGETSEDAAETAIEQANKLLSDSDVPGEPLLDQPDAFEAIEQFEPVEIPTNKQVLVTLNTMNRLVGDKLEEEMKNGNDLDGRYLWWKNYLGRSNFALWPDDDEQIHGTTFPLFNTSQMLLLEAERLGLTEIDDPEIQGDLASLRSWGGLMGEPGKEAERVAEEYSDKGWNFNSQDIVWLSRNSGFTKFNGFDDPNALKIAEVVSDYLEGAPENPAIRSQIIDATIKYYVDTTGRGDFHSGEIGIDVRDLLTDTRIFERTAGRHGTGLHPEVADQLADIVQIRGATVGTSEARTLSRYTGSRGIDVTPVDYEEKLKWAAANAADTIRPYQWIPTHENDPETSQIVNDSWAVSTQTIDSIIMTEIIAEEFGGESIPRERNRHISGGVLDKNTVVVAFDDSEGGLGFHPVDQKFFDMFGSQLKQSELANDIEAAGLKFTLDSDVAGAQQRERTALAKMNDAIRRDAYRVWALDTYDETQEMLNDWGYEKGDTVRLYRGSDSAPSEKTARDWNPSGEDGDAEVKLWSLSSWSWDAEIAESFGQHGTIISAEVPIERLFASWRTGMPCKHEGEWIIFGLDGLDATLYDESDVRLTKIIQRANKKKKQVLLDEYFSNWITALLREIGEDRNTVDGWDDKPRKRPKAKKLYGKEFRENKVKKAVNRFMTALERLFG